eukprot:TRINITY_DN8237_c1_g7_i1.p3 TRINITY_DN8237_c1_g7~~TRINITY_DN8237_c1_g7_i1.p3  ORF type:complete len:271 (+),score=-24.41 TRINITY_DN8237_c1_g7_i1:96-815(+)
MQTNNFRDISKKIQFLKVGCLKIYILYTIYFGTLDKSVECHMHFDQTCKKFYYYYYYLFNMLIQYILRRKKYYLIDLIIYFNNLANRLHLLLILNRFQKQNCIFANHQQILLLNILLKQQRYCQTKQPRLKNIFSRKIIIYQIYLLNFKLPNQKKRRVNMSQKQYKTQYKLKQQLKITNQLMHNFSQSYRSQQNLIFCNQQNIPQQFQFLRRKRFFLSGQTKRTSLKKINSKKSTSKYR